MPRLFWGLCVQCSNRPVTTISPDRNRRHGVAPMLERERTAMTILDPITGNLVTIDTSGRPHS
jgi:hypothetical protein